MKVEETGMTIGRLMHEDGGKEVVGSYMYLERENGKSERKLEKKWK